MTKKKSSSPIRTLTISGVSGAVAIIIFYFVGLPFIMASENIAPQVVEPPLTIPFDEEDLDGSPDPNDNLSSNPNDPDCVAGECPPFPDPNIDPVTDDEQQMIDDAINMTETSTDPPIEQIIDEVFEPKTINLEINIVKIDSMLNRFNETVTINVPLASLFVEDTTNIDFRNGFIEMDLNLLTDPNSMIDAVGTFNINVSSTEIFPNDINLIANGLTDEDGRINLLFSPSAGIESNLVTFDFNQNFDVFGDEEVTKVSFIIKTLDIETTTEELQTNGLVNQEIYSMDIFRDDIQLLVEDSQGNVVRSYPQDDRLTITSQTATFTCGAQLAVPAGETGTAGVKCGRCSLPPSYACESYPAPQLSQIKVFDSVGSLIDANSGIGTVIDTMLFRNANYTVETQFGNFDIETPKSQKNYSYKVWQTREGDWSKRATTCSIYCMTYWWFSPDTSKPITTVHNMPIE